MKKIIVDAMLQGVFGSNMFHVMLQGAVSFDHMKQICVFFRLQNNNE